MVELNVCIGSCCHLKGSYNVIQVFQQMLEEHGLHEKVNLKSAFCNRECGATGVAVSIDGQMHHMPCESAGSFFLENILPALR